MFKNTKKRRQLSDGGLLFKTLVEFVNCWGSGKQSRLFVETMNVEAFMNFSTFLGNPGKGYSRQNKMASGEETLGYPQSHHDPNSGRKVKQKKSQKKTERDNQRAARFQKRKQEELSAAAATEGSPVSAAATSTSTPSKEFEFSEPTCENMSSLDGSNNTNVYMNLDSNVTLNDETVKLSGSQSSDVDISPEDTKAKAAHQTLPCDKCLAWSGGSTILPGWGCEPKTAACILNTVRYFISISTPDYSPSSPVDDSDVEARQKRAITWMVRDYGLPEEDARKIFKFTKDAQPNVDEVVEILDRLQELASLMPDERPVERNRKKKKKSRK